MRWSRVQIPQGPFFEFEICVAIFKYPRLVNRFMTLDQKLVITSVPVGFIIKDVRLARHSYNVTYNTKKDIMVVVHNGTNCVDLCELAPESASYKKTSHDFWDCQGTTSYTIPWGAILPQHPLFAVFTALSTYDLSPK